MATSCENRLWQVICVWYIKRNWMEGSSMILGHRFFSQRDGCLRAFSQILNQFILVHCNCWYIVYISLLFNEFIMDFCMCYLHLLSEMKAIQKGSVTHVKSLIILLFCVCLCIMPTQTARAHSLWMLWVIFQIRSRWIVRQKETGVACVCVYESSIPSKWTRVEG